MNGVPEYYVLNLKQTSKGIWYCDGFTAHDEIIKDMIILADDAMTRIEEILEKHNKEAVASEQKTN